jgi:hypothetical protein
MLQNANVNQMMMDDSYVQLEREHTQALALIGAAGVVAAVTLGVVAASAAAFASQASAAVSFWSISGVSSAVGESAGGAWVMTDYLVMNGVAPTAVAEGVQALATAATGHYVLAGTSATASAGSLGAVAWVKEKMNSGLTEAQAAKATAGRMRDGLESVCKEKAQELHRLEQDMEWTREKLRNCPDVELMPEPYEEPISVPTGYGHGPIRG